MRAVAMERHRSIADNVNMKFLPFFRSWLQPATTKVASRVLMYLVVGDVEFAYHALRCEENVSDFPHVEHVLREVEKLHGVSNGGSVPEEVASFRSRVTFFFCPLYTNTKPTNHIANEQQPLVFFDLPTKL